MASVHQEPAIQTPPLMARKTPMQWFTNGCVHYVEPLIGGPYLFAVIRPLLVVGLVFLPLYGQSGRHWAVRGPVAAMQLGQTSAAYLGKISMSVASGEAVAMIQPFWSLPARRPSLRSVAEDHRAPIHTKDAQPRPQIGA